MKKLIFALLFGLILSGCSESERQKQCKGSEVPEVWTTAPLSNFLLAKGLKTVCKPDKDAKNPKISFWYDGSTRVAYRKLLTHFENKGQTVDLSTFQDGVSETKHLIDGKGTLTIRIEFWTDPDGMFLKYSGTHLTFSFEPTA